MTHEEQIEREVQAQMKLMKAYHNTFNSESGKIVLKHLIHKTNIFADDTALTPGQMELRNFGASILQMCSFKMPEAVDSMMTGLFDHIHKADHAHIEAHVRKLIQGEQ
jgi:hypothetical protein